MLLAAGLATGRSPRAQQFPAVTRRKAETMALQPPALAWPSNPPVDSGGPVGTLPGHGSVGNNSRCRYSMPLAVPPGRNGMEPSLSLEYASHAGNALAGVGWSVGGLSKVMVCDRVATDGTAAEGGAFCLDDKRLVQIADGTYRTESESFARITHSIVDVGGYKANDWKVEHKGGLIAHYFDTVSTPVPTTDSTGIILNEVCQSKAALLRDVVDRDGNGIHYTYDKAGCGLISSIRYTDRGSSPGQRRIRSFWEARTDPYSVYHDDANRASRRCTCGHPGRAAPTPSTAHADVVALQAGL